MIFRVLLISKIAYQRFSGAPQNRGPLAAALPYLYVKTALQCTKKVTKFY